MSSCSCTELIQPTATDSHTFSVSQDTSNNLYSVIVTLNASDQFTSAVDYVCLQEKTKRSDHLFCLFNSIYTNLISRAMLLLLHLFDVLSCTSAILTYTNRNVK